MGKYDNRAFGHPLEVVFRGFMEIELEVKSRVFFIRGALHGQPVGVGGKYGKFQVMKRKNVHISSNST